MWIMTQYGFFSIVSSRREKGFLVRGRVRQDLENVRQVLGDDAPEVTVTPHADYRYRLLLSRDQWMQLIEHCASHIDYPNFKERIHRTTDQQEKSAVYTGVWEVLRTLQRD